VRTGGQYPVPRCFDTAPLNQKLTYNQYCSAMFAWGRLLIRRGGGKSIICDLVLGRVALCTLGAPLAVLLREQVVVAVYAEMT
jgi:hypothetical protein